MSLFKEVKTEMRLIRVTPTRERNEKPQVLLKALHSINPEEGQSGIEILDNIYTFSWKDKPTVRIKNKFGFFVLITKENVKYFYMAPASLVDLVTEKIKTVYPKAKVEIYSEEESYHYINMLNSSQVNEPVVTRTVDVFSINPDEKIGEAFYEVKKELKDNEFFALASTFEKVQNNAWRNIIQKYNKKLKYQTKEELEKDAVKERVLNFTSLLVGASSLLGTVTTKFSNIGNKNSEDAKVNREKGIVSKEKESEQVFRSTINLLATMGNEKKATEAIDNNFLELSRFNGDNSFEISKIKNNKKKFSVLKKNNGSNVCILSIKEMAALFALPNSSVMREYGIQYIKTNQVKLEGKMLDPTDQLFISYNHYTTTKQFAFMPDDKTTVGYMMYMFGPEGGGKTTALSNLAVSHADIKRGLCNIDEEDNCPLNNKIMRTLDYQKKYYLHIDLTGNEDKISRLSKRRTIKNISFATGDAIPDFENIKDKVEWLKNDAQEKLSIFKITLQQFGKFTESEEGWIISSAILNKLVNKDTSLADVFNTILYKEERMKLFSILEDEKYDEFVGKNGILKSQLMDLKELHDSGYKNEDVKNIKYIRNIVNASNLLSKLYNSESGETIDFVNYIKNGTIVLVSLPNNITQIERDTITMWFYNKIFRAASTYSEEDSIPYSIFMDEVYRFKAALGFLHENIVRFRKRKLRCYLTIHHIESLADTDFEKDIGKTACHIMLLPGVSVDEFNFVKTRVGNKFTYEEDIKEMNDLSKLDRKYALFCLRVDGGSRDQVFIGELPQDLSVKENLENFRKEINRYKKSYIDNTIREAETYAKLEAAVSENK